jgi:hypothetical protein
VHIKVTVYRTLPIIKSIISAVSELTFLGDDKRIGIGERELSVMSCENVIARLRKKVGIC